MTKAIRAKIAQEAIDALAGVLGVEAGLAAITCALYLGWGHLPVTQQRETAIMAVICMFLGGAIFYGAFVVVRGIARYLGTLTMSTDRNAPDRLSARELLVGLLLLALTAAQAYGGYLAWTFMPSPSATLIASANGPTEALFRLVFMCTVVILVVLGLGAGAASLLRMIGDMFRPAGSDKSIA